LVGETLGDIVGKPLEDKLGVITDGDSVGVVVGVIEGV